MLLNLPLEAVLSSPTLVLRNETWTVQENLLSPIALVISDFLNKMKLRMLAGSLVGATRLEPAKKSQ